MRKAYAVVTHRAAELPADSLADLPAHSGCVAGAGAASVEELEAMLPDEGFVDIRIQPVNTSREFIDE